MAGTAVPVSGMSVPGVRVRRRRALFAVARDVVVPGAAVMFVMFVTVVVSHYYGNYIKC